MLENGDSLSLSLSLHGLMQMCRQDNTCSNSKQTIICGLHPQAERNQARITGAPNDHQGVYRCCSLFLATCLCTSLTSYACQHGSTIASTATTRMTAHASSGLPQFPSFSRDDACNNAQDMRKSHEGRPGQEAANADDEADEGKGSQNEGGDGKGGGSFGPAEDGVQGRRGSVTQGQRASVMRSSPTRTSKQHRGSVDTNEEGGQKKSGRRRSSVVFQEEGQSKKGGRRSSVLFHVEGHKKSSRRGSMDFSDGPSVHGRSSAGMHEDRAFQMQKRLEVRVDCDKSFEIE